MKSYSNGDEIRDAFDTLYIGETILYRGVSHIVIDAGPTQGKRIAYLPDLGPNCCEDDRRRER